MAKTCAELFKDFPCTIIGNAAEEVAGLAYRSSEVQPGDAFFCIVGTVVDGHTFAQDAIDRGAKVLVAERKVYLADATDVTEVIVSDSRRAMAAASCVFYNQPSHAFSLVGITGTNGKTTTSYLVEHIARVAGKKTGVIGTVGIQVGDRRVPSPRTTPESPDLQKTLAEMRDTGCEVVAMEVSSHALDLERTWDTRFAVTAFTNLTQDHLDYHHTFEAYFEAKARLFTADYPAKRVVAINDKWGRELARRCTEAGDYLLTVGPAGSGADIQPSTVEFSARSTRVVLEHDGRTFDIAYPLAGKFNVENVLCAFAIALQLGIPAEVAAEALRTASAVPGRMQLVQPSVANTVALDSEDAISALPSVYVDYAHTPDALTKALTSVKELAQGRTIVVFGCGGDRDSEKRPIMGRAALAADLAIVTSDNPRTEDPSEIIGDIVAGMKDAEGTFEVIPDRAEAIQRAISLAGSDDCVLIAGKGHENYQIIGTETIHFDDCEVAAAALAALDSKAQTQEAE